MAQLRIMICGAVALAASAVLAGPAAAIVGSRQILDGCEVGGGNDIHSLESHYDADRNEIVVTLRLCSAARRLATYRVHLDHAAPFVGEAGTPSVGEAAAPATCATPADSVVARRPGGHRGVGASELRGNLVRFVVPLDDLDVGEPEDVPLIPLWATSSLGGTVDRAPNRETWTGTLPDGTDAGGPNCNGWTAFSAGVSGNGGAVGELGPGWTTGSIGPCNQIRYLICLQVVGEE